MDVEIGPLSDLDTLWANPSEADESQVLLLERANSLFKAGESECAFTLWETNGRQSWSQHRFDPRAAPKWRVVSTSDVQAEEPDDDDDQDRRDEGDQEPAYARQPTIDALDDLDRFFQGSDGALSILQEQEDLTVFGLVPDIRGKDVPKRVKKMRPRLTIVVSHDRPMITATDIVITKPYSPKFGLRFTDWRVTEINEYNEVTNSAVVAYRSFAMQGRVFRIARFQHTMTQWYDEFSC